MSAQILVGTIEPQLFLHLEFIAFIVFWILLLVSSCLTVYKKITFKNKIYVERYFLKTWVIPYSSIEDYSGLKIKLNKWFIATNGMENAGELIRILDSKIDEGVIGEEQIENELWKHEENGGMSSVLSFLVTLSITTLMTVTEVRLFEIEPDNLILFLIVFLSFYFCFYTYNKKFYKDINEFENEPDYDLLGKKLDNEMSLIYSFVASTVIILGLDILQIRLGYIDHEIFIIVIWIAIFLGTYLISRLYYKHRNEIEEETDW
ncbi:MAG: hypothetical protein RLN81_15060 [Balneolaceae bacterium]